MQLAVSIISSPVSTIQCQWSVSDVLCPVVNVWCFVFSFQCLVSDVLFPVFSVQCLVFCVHPLSCVQFPQLSVSGQCLVSSVQCPVSSGHCLMSCIQCLLYSFLCCILIMCQCFPGPLLSGDFLLDPTQGIKSKEKQFLCNWQCP